MTQDVIVESSPFINKATPTSIARFDTAETAVHAYARVEAEILALPEYAIGRVTADVAHAGSVALGAEPNLQKLRPEFELLNDGGRAIRALDALSDYALAALYAHLQTLPKATENELVALVDLARPVRMNLLKVADGLVEFGLLPAQVVAAIREGVGNVDLAKDVIALAVLYRSNWDAVGGKVPFGLDLVDQAAMLGPQLLRAVGVQEVGDVRKDPSFDWPALRERAFRLLMNAYEELRRATHYVRWKHGDARDYAPSLHVRSRKSTKDDEPSPEPEAKEEAPATAATKDGADVEPGMPGASPFRG